MNISAGAGIANASLNYTKLNTATKAALNYGIVDAALIHIRALIAGAVTYSKAFKDLWGEAYIDADGRSNSVNTGTTTAKFSTNKYQFMHYTTGATIGGVESTPTYNTDSSRSQNATVDYQVVVNNAGIFTEINTYNVGSSGGTNQVSVMNTAGTITYATKAAGTTAGSNVATFALSDYTVDGIVSCALPPGTYIIRHVVTGNMQLDISNATTFNGTLFDIVAQNIVNDWTYAPILRFQEYAQTTNTTNVIVHTIPTGTFSPTIENACFKAYIEDYETGITIEHKLTNAGAGDSGWFADGDIVTFGSFVAEPTTLQTRLTPKSATPTGGYPAIKGVAGVAW